MPLINCEVNLYLTWMENCFIMAGAIDNQEPTFAIPDMKLYVPVVTLSTPDDVKLLQKLKTSLKEQLSDININQNQYYRHKTDI